MPIMRHSLISAWRRAACLPLDHLTRLASHWSRTDCGLCSSMPSPTRGCLLGSSWATATVRAPPTWPTSVTSTPGVPGSASGCWLRTAARSRPTSAHWSKPAGAVPRLPGGWPPWPASTATRFRREPSPTPPPPTFVALRWRVIRSPLALTREEAVRFLAAAEAASARDHALACLLTLNGLRVSEACAADVVDLGVERAHRVLAVVGKGGQRTLVPLAPRTVRAIDAALGGRTDGPLLVSNTGGRLDRHDAARI